jgi:hypothetical protein
MCSAEMFLVEFVAGEGIDALGTLEDARVVVGQAVFAELKQEYLVSLRYKNVKVKQKRIFQVKLYHP